MDYDRTDAFKTFTNAFTMWAQRIKKVQTDSLEAFALLEKEFGINTKNYKKSNDVFIVNATTYWAAIASIASNLSLTAEHLSRQCNKASGYQIDMGEMEDVFEQQRQWNEKHLHHTGKTRAGDELRN
jgi:hypothetical protein